MKKHLLILSAVALLAGCKKADTRTEAGEGSVDFRAGIALQIESHTRAELPATCIPDVDDFTLTIESKEKVSIDGKEPEFYTKSHLFGDYKDTYKNWLIPASDYTATINYGDTEAEGATAYCFAGTVDFTIIARGNIQKTITATLTNSAVSLQVGEWFKEYYSDAEFTLHAASEEPHSFTHLSTHDDLIFVQPGTALRLSGKATKLRNGAVVEFESELIRTSVPCTWHKINIELEEVGKGTFEITTDDTLDPVTITVIELNEEA